MILSEVSTSVRRSTVQITAGSATEPSFSGLASCHLPAGLKAPSGLCLPAQMEVIWLGVNLQSLM